MKTGDRLSAMFLSAGALAIALAFAGTVIAR